jgi:hypothetical protein
MAKLRDGIIRRGTKWYYVIRVTDHETGLSRPRWVGGFSTERGEDGEGRGSGEGSAWRVRWPQSDDRGRVLR